MWPILLAWTSTTPYHRTRSAWSLAGLSLWFAEPTIARQRSIVMKLTESAATTSSDNRTLLTPSLTSARLQTLAAESVACIHPCIAKISSPCLRSTANDREDVATSYHLCLVFRQASLLRDDGVVCSDHTIEYDLILASWMWDDGSTRFDSNTGIYIGKIQCGSTATNDDAFITASAAVMPSTTTPIADSWLWNEGRTSSDFDTGMNIGINFGNEVRPLVVTFSRRPAFLLESLRSHTEPNGWQDQIREPETKSNQVCILD